MLTNRFRHVNALEVVNKDFYKIESISRNLINVRSVNVHIWKKIRLSPIRYSSLIYVKK